MPIPSVELGVPSPTHREGRTGINGRTVRKAVRWLVSLVVVAHGAIHLLGAVKGFGWAKVTLLVEPISVSLGVVWLVAAVLTMAAGGLLLARVRRWWMVGALAALASQAVIVTSWADAKVGTVANVVLAVAVVYGWASQGPQSARAEYRRRAAAALTTARSPGLLTRTDLARLPAPVAACVRRSGALGRPRVDTLHARFHGRIRGGPAKPWMTFTGEQVNTFGTRPSRLFLMDAELFGMPVEVLHAFTAGAATMTTTFAAPTPTVPTPSPPSWPSVTTMSSSTSSPTTAPQYRPTARPSHRSAGRHRSPPTATSDQPDSVRSARATGTQPTASSRTSSSTSTTSPTTPQTSTTHVQ